MTTTQPKPGQVWRGNRGTREVVEKDWTRFLIIWRRPGRSETHRTTLNRWLKWSSTATLVSEGGEDA